MGIFIKSQSSYIRQLTFYKIYSLKPLIEGIFFTAKLHSWIARKML